MRRLTIGGVGNVLLGDDGVGPYAIRLLESEYEFGKGVRVEDLGTPGLDLIVHMTDTDALILIDSVTNDATPGTVTLYRKPDILRHAPPVRLDPHSPILSESILIADFAGEAPDEVLLVGITGKHFDPDRPISDAAREGARGAVKAVLREVERLGFSYTKKPTPAAVAVWWEAAPQVAVT